MSIKSIIDWMRKYRMLQIGSYSGVVKNRVLPDDFDNKVDKEYIDSYKNAEKPTKKETKMWKKILGTIVLLIVLLITWVMYATSGMTDVAKEFFVYVKSKHYDDAYNMLSSDFKKATSKEKFINFLNSTALVNYKDASWDERAFEGDTGTLKGKVITKNGEKIPFIMKFIKTADDNWKIYSIYKPTSGIITDKEESATADKATQNKLPTKEELIPILKRDILTFAKSINAKSMEEFYQKSSKTWQSQTSVQELNTIFAKIMDSGIDFTVLNDFTPVIYEEPKIVDGALEVKFYYNTTPKKIYFNPDYVVELL